MRQIAGATLKVVFLLQSGAAPWLVQWVQGCCCCCVCVCFFFFLGANWKFNCRENPKYNQPGDNVQGCYEIVSKVDEYVAKKAMSTVSILICNNTGRLLQSKSNEQRCPWRLKLTLRLCLYSSLAWLSFPNPRISMPSYFLSVTCRSTRAFTYTKITRCNSWD